MLASTFTATTTAWLLTYLLHSTVFLGLAWLGARACPAAGRLWRRRSGVSP